MRKERVLVTGANGLLGANIVKHLLDSDNYHPVAMIRSSCNRLSLEGLNCEIFEGEITNNNDLEKVIKTCDYVIHSAALTKQNINDFSPYQKINIDVTVAIASLCLKHKIKRLVFVSTANCFTNGTLEKPGHENSPFMDWLKDVPYAYSKYLAQQEIINRVQNDNLDALIVAPTFMLGERDAGPSSGVLLLYGSKHKITFYPPGGKSFVAVKEVAKAIIQSLTKGKKGSCYLLSGENLTYRTFFEMVHQSTQKKGLLIPIPKLLFSLLGTLAFGIKKIFGIQVPFHSSNLRLLTLDNYFSNQKAIRELGMNQTDVGESIEEALVWYGRNGY
ncbi:NAD-dependent epimerase/dehydratase family protein [Flammeovirga sp. SJP92]|uniref:NAD-dependent epimerase/dehydratase family protein n=1 Tax=Flammeovirga sp. SJP92 TaxID=1775430 RepID=UPI0007873902|nr:NAD-dependent epimerase/dehydratase family protein [Flammeovirga sp. SJP92]KXX70630.1 hypothetical protein AVL50_07350 [Flammeovirga sp. SJP92]